MPEEEIDNLPQLWNREMLGLRTDGENYMHVIVRKGERIFFTLSAYLVV